MSNENTLSTAIAVLFENEMTEQGLAELRERFPADLVHDMTDDVQFKAGRKIRTERNKLVEAIKHRRIGVTSDIKVKADGLTSEVELIYASVVAPFETQLEINKLAKEKVERELKELLDGQRIKINELNDFVNDCIGKTSKSISEVIEAVDSIDTACFHKDIIHEAIEVKGNVQSRLTELLTQALNEEALQIEREKLATQQRAADEEKLIADLKAKAQERLNKLMMIPAGLFGKSSTEINDKIKSLESHEVVESEFGELFDQANSAKQQVINQLTMMHNQQKTVESAEAARDETERLARVKANNDAIKQREEEELKKATDHLAGLAQQEEYPVKGTEPNFQGVDQTQEDIAGGNYNVMADTDLSQVEQSELAAVMQSEVNGTNQLSMAESMAKGSPLLAGFDTASGNDETATLEMITITKAEHDQLLSDSLFLGCLINAGVDNWSGYSDAQEAMES